MQSYVAYLRKEKGSDYGVEFPDVPGCVTAGHTLEEAKANAAEALAGHVAVLQENHCQLGKQFPIHSTYPVPLRNRFLSTREHLSLSFCLKLWRGGVKPNL